MRKSWFHSILHKQELDYSCNLSNSTDRLSPIQDNNENPILEKLENSSDSTDRDHMTKKDFWNEEYFWEDFWDDIRQFPGRVLYFLRFVIPIVILILDLKRKFGK